MPENRIIKPFESFFVSMIFIFSTMYTLYYYYEMGTQQPLEFEGITEDVNDPLNSGFASILDSVLEFVSWISPFALVKGLIIILFQSNTPELYTAINLLLLRPIGWIGALFTANYLISKIPTVSPE